MRNKIICVIMIVIVAVSIFNYPIYAADLSEFEKVFESIEKKLRAAERKDKPSLKSLSAEGNATYYTYPPITDEMVNQLVLEYMTNLRNEISALGELSPDETQRLINQLSLENSYSEFYWTEANTKVVLSASINTDFSWIYENRTKADINKAADTYFDGVENKPSEWAKTVVREAIERGFIPDNLKSNYQRSIALGEYVQLYTIRYNELVSRLFQSDSYNISLSDSSVTDESPDYVKFAFLAGLIDHTDELSLTMTRKEAAIRFSRLVGASIAAQGSPASVRDNLEISPDALDAVGIATAYGIINPIDGYFMPNNAYTVEQAIYDIYKDEYARYGYNYIRGIIDLSELYGSSCKIGRDFLYMRFEDKKAAEEYIKCYVGRRISFFDEFIAGKRYDIPITGKYQKIDVGYMIIELNSPDYDVKYTFKKGAENIDVRNFTDLAITYGKDNYRSEPREIRPGEQVSMEIQPDSIHQKLYEKIDEILKQIIKPDMTQEQKVRAIHDYVVTKVTYSSGTDYLIGDNALKAIETGKGVCVHYTMLFYHLCKRAGIPVRNIIANSFVGWHSWNVVYIDGKWLHVDTTLDDAKGRISHEYYLKDSDYMLKTRFFNGYGVTDQQYYGDIDGMNIQSADELRAYLIKQVELGNIPDTIKFRLSDKNIDTNVEFLRFIFFEGKYKVKYDAQQDLYIATKYR